MSELWCRFTTIFYSVVTFTTLCFGDVVPETLWVMAEVMLGGLISIFANKMVRRN